VRTSIAGVPVMPSGSMLPQGKDERGTAVPTAVFHASAPVRESSAYTRFCSVATNTSPWSVPGVRQ
jgi:hypothetical protein